MSNSLSHGVIVRRKAEAPVSPLHLLVLFGVCLAVVIWGTNTILGNAGHQFQTFLALLAFYTAASALFVLSRIRSGKLQLFEIPVYITCMCFLNFGLAPVRNFIDPSQIGRNLSENGEELVQALAYVLLGMMAFWGGCQAARGKRVGLMFSGRSQEDTASPSREQGMILSTVALYAVGFGTKFFLLRSHLYSYTGSNEKYNANLAAMQVVNTISIFGTFALVVATIERYRKLSNSRWKVLFWAIFSSEILWGAVSGMKGTLLVNFLVVALASSVIQRKLNLRWLVLPFVVLVLIYPISDAYRAVLTGRGAQEVTSFQEAGRAGQIAFRDATQSAAGRGGLWHVGQTRTAARFDLLTSVAQVLVLGPRASLVRGHTAWWMIPIYPFIPRFIWRTKPILDKGAWFTVALNGSFGTAATAGSSTAITYPGDLYLEFGLLGIPIGMFVLGVVVQLITNRLSGPVEPRDLFLYACVFLFGFPLEADVFAVWASLIKLLAILFVLSRLIYGPRRPHPGRLSASRNPRVRNRKIENGSQRPESEVC